SAFTGGTWRTVYSGVDDIKSLIPDLSAQELAETDFGAYTTEDFFDDMGRVTHYRTNPDLCEFLFTRSNEPLNWLVREQAVRYLPEYATYTTLVDGKRKFFGGVALLAAGAGLGLVDSLYAAVKRRGIEIHYETQAQSLLETDRKVRGVRAIANGKA